MSEPVPVSLANLASEQGGQSDEPDHVAQIYVPPLPERPKRDASLAETLQFIYELDLTTADLEQRRDAAYKRFDLLRLEIKALTALLTAAKKMDGTWVGMNKRRKPKQQSGSR